MATVDFRYAPGHTAIVIIDMQNDYCHPKGSLAKLGCNTAGAMAIVPQLVRLVGEARRRGVPIVFIRTTHGLHDDSHAWLNRYGHTEGDEPEGTICREHDAWGTDWYGIHPLREDLVVTKHRYSAFSGTSLAAMLRVMSIQSLLFTGVSTEICVESSVRDALFEDFYVSLVSDCTASYSSDAYRASVDVIRNNFGTIITASELVDLWKPLA